MVRNSRIPLDEIKRHPNGRLFSEVNDVVQPRQPDNTHRH